MGGTDDSAKAVALRPDGRIVVAGEARKDANSLVTFALAGYLSNGDLDQSFGGGGKVYTAFGANNGSGANALAIQADGKIVVAGYAANPAAHHNTFALARYNPDGSLDNHFGSNGKVLTQIGQETGAGPEDRANAIAIDGQGRIVVAGETGSFMLDMAVSRYLSDGSLDASFGNGGMVVTDFGGDDRAQSVVVQPDGKILVGGSGWIDSGAQDFAVMRLLDDGSVDRGFGIGGKLVTDFRGGDDTGQALLLRPDGRFVLVGTIQLSGGCAPNPCERYGFGAASYTSSGALDSGFGSGGRIEPDFVVSSGAYGAALLPSGVIAMTGHIGNEDFGVAFMDDHGAPIQRSDGSEATRIDFAGESDRAFAAVAAPDDTVILAGDATLTDGGFDFALARYAAPSP